ncbi:MAG: glycosyltransferase family 2 protein [Alphaproteobacteria bacterium]|nr:glycosyltransferase family 2 protein [Alphaproteobacteria bacterium]
MPKVSVLMTAYNSERYIAEAIESILNQTFSDFEFLIINDGSTDKTADIIAQYAKTDKRIRFIDNKKNQGLIAVLNQGLDLARGEYIARMDSDDIAMPERLEKQVAYLDENPHVGAVGGWHEKFGENINPSVRQYPERAKILDMLIVGTPLSHPTTTIRTSVLRDNKIYYNPDFPHAEDYEIWSQIIKVAPIHNVPEKLLRYRWHNMNVSVVSQKIQRESAERVKANIIEYITDDNRLKEHLMALAGETNKHVRLFGFLPIIRKKQYGITKTKYYLFEKIPLLKVQDGEIYLFEFIKIGRIA